MDDRIINEYYFIIKNKILQGDFISASRSTDKLLFNFPSDAMGYYFRGLCYFAREKYEDSLKSYYNAIKLNPNFAKAYFNLGVCYHVLNYYDEALINIAKALVIFANQKELSNKQRCIEALRYIDIERLGNKG